MYNVKLALITSDTTLNAKNTLKKLYLDSYFDLVIGGDINLKKKSSGEPALYTCKKLDLNTKNVIAIGDAEMLAKYKSAMRTRGIMKSEGKH